MNFALWGGEEEFEEGVVAGVFELGVKGDLAGLFIEGDFADFVFGFGDFPDGRFWGRGGFGFLLGVEEGC